MNAYYILFGAIVCEITATSFLKKSNGFVFFIPSITTVIFYALSFYLLSLVLKELPIFIVYAMWSGLGIVLITITSWFAFGQKIDLFGGVGILLIISGIIVINLFSTSFIY